MSGKWQVVQPAHTGGGAAAGVGEIDASNASYTGTVVITGGANITVSSAAGNKVVIVGGAGGAGGSFSAGLSNIGNTLGNTGTVSNQLVLAGGNNVTLSQSTDAGGATVTISGVNTVAQSVQTQNLVDLTLSGNTAGVMALVSSGTATLAGGNNVTLSQAGNAITISGPNTSAQQTAISGVVGSNATYTSGTVTFTGVGGGITVSSNTGQRIDLSVAAPVAQTGTQFSAGISGGNTLGDTGTVAGRVVFAGGNNITLSGSTNGVSETITISGPAAGGAQTGISSIAATNTTYTSGQVEFTGSNMVTVKSSANQRVVIDATQTVQTQNMVAIAASNTTFTSGTVVLSASGGAITINSAAQSAGFSVPQTSSLSAFSNITLSVNASTIKFSVADPPKNAAWRNFEHQNAGTIVNITGISKTPFYFEEVIPGGVTLNSVILHMSNVTTATLQSLDIHFGVYTFVNSTSIALLGSASNNFNISTASSASWTGQQEWVLTSPSTVAGISNLTPGNYVFGLMFSAGATGSMNQLLYGVSNTSVAPLGRILPGNNQLSTATSQGAMPMLGQGSTTVNVMPANVVASELRNQGSVTVPFRPWMMIRS